MSCRVNCLDCGCEVLWHDNLTDRPFADHVSGGVDCLRNQLAQKDAENERLKGALFDVRSLTIRKEGLQHIAERVVHVLLPYDEPKQEAAKAGE